MYRLARNLTPDSFLWEDIPVRRPNFDSARRLQVQASCYMQLLFLSKLPSELRSQIWQYVGLETPYTAFILTSEICRLAHKLRRPSFCNINIQEASRLSAKMISVFDMDYIQDLVVEQDFVETLRPFQKTIGVSYITSFSGLCAIQLLGMD